jgi:alkylated DNA repair dioxygenase AlkB
MAVSWQPSLGGDAPTSPAASAPARRHLTGGAWVDHAPGWLAGADRLMDELLRAAPWRQRRRRLYDREVDEPRLTAWWRLGPESLRYELGAGDLFVMGGTAQRTWQHHVPKVRAAGARVSVTYRHAAPLPAPGQAASDASSGPTTGCARSRPVSES